MKRASNIKGLDSRRRDDVSCLTVCKHAFRASIKRAYAPIEGGQSLADVLPCPKRGPFLLRTFIRFPDDYSRTDIDFQSGSDDNSGMGKLLFDLEGNDLPKPEGYRKLGGMVRPLAKAETVKLPPIEFKQEPAKIFERPAEPPVEVKAVKSGRGRPKKEGRRPWEEAGMSKSTWYEKKSKGEV